MDIHFVHCAVCDEWIDTTLDGFLQVCNDYIHTDCSDQYYQDDRVYRENIDKLIESDPTDFYLHWVKDGDFPFTPEEKAEIEREAYMAAYERKKQLFPQSVECCAREYWREVGAVEGLERLGA